jgi:hypothetical protein
MSPNPTRTCRTITFLFLFFIGARTLAQPVIKSFAPLHGVVNGHLTIWGTGLKPSSGSPVVHFGYELATVQSVTDTAVVVLIPGPGIDGPISITVNGLTAVSSQFFTCTFSNGGAAFSASSFGAHQDMPGGVNGLTVADFYGNGSANMLSLSGWPTTGPVTSTFIINTNTGSGGTMNYSQSTTISALSVPQNDGTADFDGDGKMDVLVDALVSGYSGFSVFRNTTAGPGNALTFASPVSVSARAQGNGWAAGLYVADFDGDGKADVIYSVIMGQYSTRAQKDSIHYFHNTCSPGTISFQETGGMSGTLLSLGKVADFDGDGKPDIVGFGSDPVSGAQEVYLLRNTSSPGNISFAAPLQLNPNSYLDGDDLAVGDLDGDGKIDIAVTTDYGPVLFRNTGSVGSPSFSYADLSDQSRSIYYEGPSIAMGDLDGDGKADIVIGDPVDDQVVVFRNTSSNGTLSLDPRVVYATNPAPHGSFAPNLTVIADVNYDGKPDIVQLNNGTQYISVLLNQLPASTAPTVTSFSPATGGAGTQVTITGTNLTGVDSVSFGGVAVKSFTINSATSITAVIGNGATGSLIIDASTGRDTTGAFTFIATQAPPPSAPLQLIRFSPDSAAAGGAVYIYGQHLDSISSISFGNVAARSFSILGDTLLIAIVDTGASGRIQVSGEWGTDSLSGFRYIGSAAQDTTSTNPPPPAGSFQLQQFNGIDSTEGVLLFWNTLYDQKMKDYFIFGGQDSSNLGDEFGLIPSLKQNAASYSYSANLNKSGPWYFQLRMSDTSGALTLSPVITVVHRSNRSVINSYPNPVAGQLTVAVPSSNSASWLQMTDPAGQVVRTINVASNTLQVTVDVSGLKNGVYNIVWSDGKHKSVSSVLVIK